MPPRTPPPKLKLSRLRDIGWSVWDPIGLLGADQRWNDEDCLPFADEYDSYLKQAAGRLRRGELTSEVAAYLAEIEVEYMSLGGPFQDALARAEQVVEAIQADTELWIYQDR
ncbi:hypothetical protein MWU61_16240 [Loktanella sp. F6476L]|uniref:hypothetical protein n=1 Tax=Loktanella sp. F6476L TaxID=2926405 RepID=UPI001FF11C6F|nr:hypothetical protein [Loktanella sp. F6476L]MCK0122103.1 hypothetical protein [Loktanella sp. F6476L]